MVRLLAVRVAALPIASEAMMKKLALLFLLLAASCGNPQDDYCESFGVREGDVEYGKCSQYFSQQQALFSSDRAVCALQADQTYPPSLYSRPYSYPVRFYGGRGGFAHTEMVHVGADYQQNAEVDRLRMRIIEPCMQARGWNSGATWQAGRHAGTPVTATVLPWSH